MFSFCAVSCVDDLLDDNGFIPEGETDIAVEVDFTPFSAMEVRSFQTNVPGNHLANIEWLSLLHQGRTVSHPRETGLAFGLQ